MSKEQPSITDILATLEQFETAVANTAPVIASYYKQLRAGGISVELAEQLVMDWHHIFWMSQFPSKYE